MIFIRSRPPVLLDPNYTGEADGGPSDPTVHWLGDAPGPIGLEVNDAYGTHKIDGAYDTDYFAVRLVAGHEYVFHGRGASTDDGTLDDPMVFGMWRQNGADAGDPTTIAAVKFSMEGGDNGGVGNNGRLKFTPDADGLYYFGVVASDWAID